MSHVYHESLENYVEGAVFQDGCDECESRAARFSIGHMDTATWVRTRMRAFALSKGHLDQVSRCEVPLLRLIGDVLMQEKELGR